MDFKLLTRRLFRHKTLGRHDSQFLLRKSSRSSHDSTFTIPGELREDSPALPALLWRHAKVLSIRAAFIRGVHPGGASHIRAVRQVRRAYTLRQPRVSDAGWRHRTGRWAALRNDRR